MKVALCQINTTLGDYKGNTEKILNALEQSANADIAIFPELALSSYPPLDLLDRSDFIRANEEALKQLQDQIASLKNSPKYIVLGSITSASQKIGRAIHNSAVLFEKTEAECKLLHTQAKRLLPTYDVFDESRYFEPGTETKLIETSLGKIGICICEDAWFEEKIQGRQIYQKDPAADLKGADLVINISASPFELNKRSRRREMISQFAKRTAAQVIYVNQVGANDEILFDGASFILSAKGEVLFEMPAFLEKTETIDTSKLQPIAQAKENDIELLHLGLVTGIRDYFKKTGFSKAVLGLSGGIDSAVTACLAVEALGKENVIGIGMPGPYSSSHSLTDAEDLAKNLGIEFRVHPIKFIFSTLNMEVKTSFQNKPADTTEENMQSRLRAIVLLAVANKRGALVLTTGNKSELAVGYCTTYGDMAGAIGPLGDVYKTQVYELAKEINKKKLIPLSSIEKPPSAELKPNQTDEASLGAYADLDRVLRMHLEEQKSLSEIEKSGIDKSYLEKILKLVKNSEFKRRQAAPVLKCSNKAFGIGRRMPIAKRI